MICPHNKKIEFVNKYGIKIYTHADGTNCDCLNSLIISTNDILSNYSKTYGEDFMFCCSPKIRRRRYLEFSRCKNKDKALEILKLFYENLDYKIVSEELSFVFGIKPLNNLFADYNFSVILPSTNIFYNEEIIDKKLKHLPLPSCLSKTVKTISQVQDALKKKVDKINNNKNMATKYFNF